MVAAQSWWDASASTSAAISQCRISHPPHPWPLFHGWLGGSLVVFALSLLFALLSACVATSGPVLDPHGARAAVPTLLTLRAVLTLAEAAAAGLGSYLVWGTRLLTCEALPDSLVHAVYASLVLQWTALLVSLCCAGTSYLALGGRRAAGLAPDSYRARWERRVKLIGCTARGTAGQESLLYTDSGSLLHKLFTGGGYDVVPSDIAAGLIALARDQKASGVRLVTANPPELAAELAGDAAALGPASVPPGMDLAAAAYFAPYSFASYGWPLYTLTKLCACGSCGPCSLLKCACCCFPCEGRAASASFTHGVVGEYCCAYNTAALTRVLPPERRGSTQLLHANFRNTVFQPAYMVAVDRAASSVVVAVRGTLSMDDTLTDAVARAVRLSELARLDAGFPAAAQSFLDGYVHDGIARAAAWVHNQVFGDGVPGLAASVSAALAEFGDAGSLVLVGHSLGAGTVALLSLLVPPDTRTRLRVFAYACPAVMSLDLARAVAPFIVTPFLDYDIVPRLSVRNVFELRENIMHALAHEPANKHALVCGCAKPRTPTSPSESASVNQSGTPESALLLGSTSYGVRPVPLVRPDPAAPALLPGMDESDLVPLGTPLYPPGTLMQVCAGSGSPSYSYVDPRVLDKVLAASSMFMDHMPWSLFDVLEDLNAP